MTSYYTVNVYSGRYSAVSTFDRRIRYWGEATEKEMKIHLEKNYQYKEYERSRK